MGDPVNDGDILDLTLLSSLKIVIDGLLRNPLFGVEGVLSGFSETRKVSLPGSLVLESLLDDRF